MTTVVVTAVMVLGTAIPSTAQSAEAPDRPASAQPAAGPAAPAEPTELDPYLWCVLFGWC